MRKNPSSNWRDSQRIAGVLLDAENGELDGDVEGWVRDVGLLVTETHRADEAYTSSDLFPAQLTSRGRLTFVFHWPSGEVRPDKRGLGQKVSIKPVQTVRGRRGRNPTFVTTRFHDFLAIFLPVFTL